MPVMKNRKGASRPSAQIRRPTAGDKSRNIGQQSFDGRTNTQSGTKHSALPSTLEGKAVVVRTYGS